MGASKANHTHRLAAPCVNHRMRQTIDSSERNKARFAIIKAGICDYDWLSIKPRKIRQRETMFGKIRGVFFRIEADCPYLM